MKAEKIILRRLEQTESCFGRDLLAALPWWKRPMLYPILDRLEATGQVDRLWQNERAVYRIRSAP